MNDERISRYDPFEDTGDWPFRDAPPKPEQPRAEEPPAEAALGAGVAESTMAAPPEPTSEPDEIASEDLALVPADVSDADADAGEDPAPIAEAAILEEAADEAQPPEEGIAPDAPAPPGEHASGALVVPPEVDLLEGGPHGFRRNVAVVVSRFNGDITTRLLDSAVEALRRNNVANDAITVVPVPGAFELPLAALALAKTRRFACVVALGCVIRGETAHFDLIAGEAASGLQLAAIETGIPVSFGVIACETREQAEARVDRGAEAAETALEMADLFSQVRTRAAAGS